MAFAVYKYTGDLMTYDQVRAVGAISNDTYEKLSQEEKDRYAAVQYIKFHTNKPETIESCYIPIEKVGVNPFGQEPILTDTSVPISEKTANSLGSISSKTYQALSQEEKDRYVRIFFSYSSNPDAKDIAYVPINAIPPAYFTSIAMEPWSERIFKPDGTVSIYSGPVEGGGKVYGYIYEDGGYLVKVYKQRVMDGAQRAANYINFFNKRGEILNLDELVSIVMNDYGSVLSYQGAYSMTLRDGTTLNLSDSSSVDKSYLTMVHDYAREAVEAGAQTVVDLVKEKIAEAQAAKEEVASSAQALAQTPIAAGMGTVGTIGIIALLGLSLRTMMQKRRK